MDKAELQSLAEDIISNVNMDIHTSTWEESYKPSQQTLQAYLDGLYMGLDYNPAYSTRTVNELMRQVQAWMEKTYKVLLTGRW